MLPSIIREINGKTRPHPPNPDIVYFGCPNGPSPPQKVGGEAPPFPVGFEAGGAGWTPLKATISGSEGGWFVSLISKTIDTAYFVKHDGLGCL